MLKKFLFLIFLIFLNLNGNELNSNDEFSDSDFEDDEIIEIVKTEKKDDLTIFGYISNSLNYSYRDNKNDRDDITSFKFSTNLQMEYIGFKDYKIRGTIKSFIDYKTDIDDDYDFDINELTIERTLKNGIDIKFGRQIIVWGKSDNIRITDMINSLDSRTPGIVDIEDLRVGRVATKIDYYPNDWQISAILLHENRYSIMPENGSDYFNAKMDKMFADEPTNNLKNMGVALSATANLEAQDIAFYYLNQYVDNKNYKTNMVGMAYNKVIDNFLYKAEIAYFDNYDSDTIDKKIDSLIGLEYNGIDDGAISFEVANKDDEVQYAIRFNQSYINQTLTFTALYNGYGSDLSLGSFLRVWLDYDIDDNFSTTLGIINYSDGDKLIFKNIKDNDRIFGTIRYNF